MDFNNIKTKDYWKGGALADTTRHILAYRDNNDSDYFEKHLYLPFLSLIHYWLNSFTNGQYNIRNNPDVVQDCFLNFQKILHNYKAGTNAYSYFNTVTRNKVMQFFDFQTKSPRDFRKEVYYDSMSEHEKDYLENSMIKEEEREEFNVESVRADLLNILNHFKCHLGGHLYPELFKVYYQIANGELDLNNARTFGEHGLKKISPIYDFIITAAGNNPTNKNIRSRICQFHKRLKKMRIKQTIKPAFLNVDDSLFHKELTEVNNRKDAEKLSVKELKALYNKRHREKNKREKLNSKN